MNLKEEVTSYIDSHDFDDFAKIRWIYLYVCLVFSYDIKYIFGNNKAKNNIYNKEIDITNVNEFEIICYTISKVIVDLLDIYHIRSKIVREIDKNSNHVYVLADNNGEIIKLDPMIQHDTSRIKMGIKTLNFSSLEEGSDFLKKIKEADNVIGYPFTNNFPKSYSNLLNDIDTNKLRGTDIFLKKLDLIIDLVNHADSLTRYDDIDYYLGYLIKKLKINSPINYVKPAIFYKINEEGNWDIVNLILIEKPELPIMFYKMSNETGKYLITEIDKDEVIYYLDNYNSICEYYFRVRAEKMQR